MKTVAFYTLGCKVNIYESNALMNDFKKNGYEIVSNDIPADVYIINTCSVTNMADSKSKKMIRHAKKLNPNAIICVMGCFAQTNPDAKKMEEIDILLGNGNKSKAVGLVNEALEKKNHNRTVDILNIRQTFDYENLEAVEFDHTRAFVKIEDGCSNFCSYCIIPYARGPVRCKNKDLVITELKKIAAMGYKEVVLAGIHTGHYTCGPDYKLSNLLKDIIKNVPELERIRLSSIEINEIDDDIIDLMSSTNIIADHMHLPLQSGSDKILKLMNRRYDKAFFKEKIEKIRSVRPDISITTDVMVGFPYEEDEDFMECVDFIKEINFSELHVFPYSMRKGTKAYDMPQVKDSIKKERTHILLGLSKELKKSYYERFVGKTAQVLVETLKDEKNMIGHTSNYLHVIMPLDSSKIGKDVEVTLESTDGEYFYAKLND